MSKKDEFVEKMKKQLDAWSADIDTLQVKAALAKAEFKTAYEEQIADLRRKRAEGEKSLDNIRAAADESWEKLRGEAERTWGVFKQTLNQLKSRIK